MVAQEFFLVLKHMYIREQPHALHVLPDIYQETGCPGRHVVHIPDK